VPPLGRIQRVEDPAGQEGEEEEEEDVEAHEPARDPRRLGVRVREEVSVPGVDPVHQLRGRQERGEDPVHPLPPEQPQRGGGQGEEAAADGHREVGHSGKLSPLGQLPVPPGRDACEQCQREDQEGDAAPGHDLAVVGRVGVKSGEVRRGERPLPSGHGGGSIQEDDDDGDDLPPRMWAARAPPRPRTRRRACDWTSWGRID
jgi:hypothetical protein